MSTRNKLVFAVVVGLLALPLIGCGQSATAGRGPEATPLVSALQAGGEPMPRTISVNGMGVASARPDVALIQLGVETVDSDAGLAIS